MMATFTISTALRSGTFTSPAVTVPAGVTEIDLTGTLAAGDLANAANTVAITIQISHDGGVTWQTRASSAWEGNTVGRAGLVPPNIRIAEAFPGELAGSRMRGIFTINPALNIGGLITTIP